MSVIIEETTFPVTVDEGTNVLITETPFVVSFATEGVAGVPGPAGPAGAPGPPGPIAGLHGQIIFNNDDIADGDPSLTWDTNNKRFVIKGHPAQSVNLQEWQASGGQVLASISMSGQITAPYIGGNNTSAIVFDDSSHSVRIYPSGMSTWVPLTVRGGLNQTANLTEWQDIFGTVLTNITSAGHLRINQGNLPNIQTITINNAGGGDTGLGYNLNGGGEFYLENASTSFQIRMTNRALKFRVDNNAFDPSTPQAFLFENNVPTTRKVMVVKGMAGQTASLQEWQDSNGAVLASVGVSGTTVLGGVHPNVGGLTVQGFQSWLLTLNNPGQGWSSKMSPYVGNVLFVDAGVLTSEIQSLQGTAKLLTSWSGVNPFILTNVSVNANVTPLTVRGGVGQTGDLQQWQDSNGSLLATVKSNGALQPAHLVDADAANDTIYYSVTANKLCYKTSAGVVSPLH